MKTNSEIFFKIIFKIHSVFLTEEKKQFPKSPPERAGQNNRLAVKCSLASFVDPIYMITTFEAVALLGTLSLCPSPESERKTKKKRRDTKRAHTHTFCVIRPSTSIIACHFFFFFAAQHCFLSFPESVGLLFA